MWSIILYPYHSVNLIVDVGLILQGHLLPAIDFVSLHRDCLLDIALLSTVKFKFSSILLLYHYITMLFFVQISWLHFCSFIIGHKRRVYKSMII